MAGLLGAGAGAIITLVAPSLARAVKPPDYQVKPKINLGLTEPLRTLYWVAPAGYIDPSAIDGCHGIVYDRVAGANVLRLISQNWYQVGAGDTVFTYDGVDSRISNRICGEPPKFKPELEVLTIPAYWNSEFTLTVRVPNKQLKWYVENWEYHPRIPGNCITHMVIYERGKLYISRGSRGAFLLGDFTPPDDYFTIRHVADFRTKQATVEWHRQAYSYPLNPEACGIVPSSFSVFYVTLTEPGELYVKDLDIKFWNPILLTEP